MDFELLFATEGQLITERGNPPEEETELSEDEFPEYVFLCKHGEDPDTCFDCKEDQLLEDEEFS